MEHAVFYSAADGAPAVERAESLERAVGVVERLRNDEGVTDAEVFALRPVPVSFRTYFVAAVADPADPDAAPLVEAEATLAELAEVPVAAGVESVDSAEFAPLALEDLPDDVVAPPDEDPAVAGDVPDLAVGEDDERASVQGAGGPEVQSADEVGSVQVDAVQVDAVQVSEEVAAVEEPAPDEAGLTAEPALFPVEAAAAAPVSEVVPGHKKPEPRSFGLFAR